MFAIRLTSTILSFCLTLATCSGGVRAQKRPTVRPRTVAPRATQQTPASRNVVAVAVGVLPFKNSLGDAALDALGGGIADSLTNALKSSASLTVADTEIVGAAVLRAPKEAGAGGDAGALNVARFLGLRMIVVGSYQRVGGQLRVEARVLSVDLNRPLSGLPIQVTQPYPDGYSELLNQLAHTLMNAMQVPLTPDESADIKGALRGVPTLRAQALYDRGLAEMREGTEAKLKSAIRLFTQAVALDPNFALAHAAKATADLELYQLVGGVGRDALAREALNDAVTASEKAPNSGSGQVALARVHNALGNYPEAEAAARKALQRWPRDAGARFELGRARGRGRLTPNEDLRLAFNLQPGLALRLPGLPKVLVKNERDHALVVTFSQRGGGSYAPVSVGAYSSRIVALLPGDYRITARGPDGDELIEKNMEAGSEYALVFAAYDSSFVVKNIGRVTAHVQIRGPRNIDLPLPPSAEKKVHVPPGQYTVTLSGANVRSVSKTYDIGSSEEVGIEVIIRRGALQIIEEEPEPVESSTFIITNIGRIAATVQVRGPKSFSVPVGAGVSKRLSVPAGEYLLLVHARGQLIGEYPYTLGAGEEHEYKFEVFLRRSR
jgi:tetratricopeptide (TPR) repeat protein/TolB-like protein